jgi:hypothetical protein
MSKISPSLQYQSLTDTASTCVARLFNAQQCKEDQLTIVCLLSNNADLHGRMWLLTGTVLAAIAVSQSAPTLCFSYFSTLLLLSFSLSLLGQYCL